MYSVKKCISRWLMFETFFLSDYRCMTWTHWHECWRRSTRQQTYNSSLLSRGGPNGARFFFRGERAFLSNIFFYQIFFRYCWCYSICLQQSARFRWPGHYNNISSFVCNTLKLDFVMSCLRPGCYVEYLIIRILLLATILVYCVHRFSRIDITILKYFLKRYLYKHLQHTLRYCRSSY